MRLLCSGNNMCTALSCTREEPPCTVLRLLVHSFDQNLIGNRAVPWDHATQTDAPPPKLFGAAHPRRRRARKERTRDSRPRCRRSGAAHPSHFIEPPTLTRYRQSDNIGPPAKVAKNPLKTRTYRQQPRLTHATTAGRARGRTHNRFTQLCRGGGGKAESVVPGPGRARLAGGGKARNMPGGKATTSGGGGGGEEFNHRSYEVPERGKCLTVPTPPPEARGGMGSGGSPQADRAPTTRRRGGAP